MSKNTKKLVPELRFPDFLGREGWQEKTLKDAITPVAREVSKPSTNYLALGIRSHGKGTFQKPDQAPEKNAMDKLYLVNREDLIVNITFAWEGAIAIANDADHGCYVSHRFPTYIFKSDVTSPNFFRYVVNRKSFFYKLGLISPGGAGRNRVMSKKDFLELAVDLPDLKEQQKIADCLSSIDDLITAQSQKVEALKTHKKGLMQQLFPREGETVPRLRFPEFRDAGEWVNKLLSEVCHVLQGYGFPEVLQGNKKGKYPFCKVSDISRAVAENGGLLVEATNYIDDEKLKQLKAKLIPKGATVFAKIGEALRLNRRAYVQNACLIDNNATGLKAIDGVAVDYFVYLLSQLIDLNDHCGGAVPSVNKSTLEAIKLFVPKPDEQQKIADCLSSVDDLISAQSRKLETLKTHKEGLMQQLFPSTKADSE